MKRASEKDDRYAKIFELCTNVYLMYLGEMTYHETYSQVQGSPVLNTLSFDSLNWISVARFKELKVQRSKI